MVTTKNGQVDSGWTLNWDRDDASLPYAVERRDKPAAINTARLISHYWSRLTVEFIASSVVTGGNYSCRIRTTDLDGNGTVSDWIRINVPGGLESRDSIKEWRRRPNLVQFLSKYLT